ncbi:LVIVD repeat-containing protein [Myxococcus fulvus]|uniref:LVIVD repeat-containing protein n=1 Tax=Myxococcus TaxID=32 RepID=UPI0020C12749|nr:hypothetical protein [Myxococcus fulvus]MCK8498326.1 hypothetical protein [Myxococcus fulvus]
MKSSRHPLGPWRCIPLLLLLLSACDDSPSGDDAGSLPDSGSDAGTADSGPPPEDAGMPDAGTPDAGRPPWDGTYTALEDRGDWIDTGRHDTCQFVTPEDLDPQRCESIAAFDLSSCSTEQLSGVENQGIFQLNLREEASYSSTRPPSDSVYNSFAGLRLSADGTQDAYGPAPLIARVTEGGTFFLAARRTSRSPWGDSVTTTALAGCHVLSPGVITGCYVSCNSHPMYGFNKSVGTFRTERMTWAPGENEASGGLALVAEASTTVGMPVDVYVAKEHAYVVSVSTGPLLGGLSVFDVKDRTSPTLVKTVTIAGDGAWNGVWAKGDALYVASDSSGLIVFDITDPANPVFVRHAEGPDAVHTVLVEGERLFANSPGTGTFVYDITSPLAPTLLQLITWSPEGYTGGPHDVFVHGDRLYISNDTTGFHIMDISDLDDVRHLGDYLQPGFFGIFSHHNAVGTFAGRTLAFVGGEFTASHVRVLDVTDPTNIPLIGTFRMRPLTSMHNLLLRGNLLYVAWYQEGLRVLDVSHPTQPRQLAHFNTYRETDPRRGNGIFEGAFGVRIPGDGFVYLVDSSRGLIIVNEL